MGSVRRRRPKRRAVARTHAPQQRPEPEPSVIDDGAARNEMSWLAPQALPWLEPDQALTA